MATTRENILANGRKSYTIQVKYKDKFYSKTWKVPEKADKNEVKRLLQQEQSDFERKIRTEVDFKSENITFREFSNEWLKSIQSSKSKTHYYRSIEIVKFLNERLGDKQLKNIAMKDVDNIFFYLNNKEIVDTKAMLVKPLDEFLQERKIKDICNNCGFTKTTFQFVRKGKTIEWKTARAICKEFNININEYFEKIEIKKNYALETKLKYKRTLCAIFNYAIQHELINRNYAMSTYLKGKISGEKQEKDILNEQETKQLNAAIEKEPILKRRLAMSILLYMGLRVGELAGLEWKDIDFEERTMSICRSTNYIPRVGEYTKAPKTQKSKRKLFLPDKIYNLLMEYKKEYDREKERLGDAWIDRDRIICSWNGKPTYSGTFNNWLTDILVTNGIRRVTPHSLRHTCLTFQLRSGIAPQTVAKWAGHSSTSVTLNTYAHFLQEDSNECAKFINTAFE